MSDIELVIKMPESIWVAIQNGEYCGILDDRTYNAIRNGTPLDKVRAEIADIYCGQYCENPLTADAVREMILDILDNIGKEERSE